MFITPDKMDGKALVFPWYVIQQYEIQRCIWWSSPYSIKWYLQRNNKIGIRVKEKEYYTNKNGYKIIAPGDIRNEIIYISMNLK